MAISDPFTALTISPSSKVGNNGWYVTNLELELTATASAGVKNISYYLDNPPVTVVESSVLTRVFSVQGGHRLYYWAVDKNLIEETPHKYLDFKIDSIAPTNWHDFTFTRFGNDHTEMISVQMDDAVSGLDILSAKYQYTTDGGDNWGYYQNFLFCRAQDWIAGGWVAKPPLNPIMTPLFSGAKSEKMTTMPVDFCNSNFGGCEKAVKFQIKDLAGNVSQNTNCLGSSFLKTTGGDIHVNGNLNGGTGSTADGVVSAAGSISGVSSGKNWVVSSYLNQKAAVYEDLLKSVGGTSSLPGGSLKNLGNGAYLVESDFVLDNNTAPSGVNTQAVVFVGGDLTVSKDYALEQDGRLVFVVKKNLRVSGKVEAMEGFFIVGESFESDYDGQSAGANRELVINGGLAANSVKFSRAFKGNKAQNQPAETINYEPKYVVSGALSKILGREESKWRETAP